MIAAPDIEGGSTILGQGVVSPDVQAMWLSVTGLPTCTGWLDEHLGISGWVRSAARDAKKLTDIGRR